jgi:microcystin-dependent protein
MPVHRWSQTASTDATADPTINWSEGQAPSTINDSARAMMAALAQYRDDMSGVIVTTGTSTAYGVASFSIFDSLAHLNGQVVAFTPHVTNGDGPVTLNVDSLGGKPLRSAPNVDLTAGTLVQGTPYAALYNKSDDAFYLSGFYSSPFNVPFLGGMDYWDTVAPNSSFIFPTGQAISRTVYARAFAKWGTKFGAGDGSTTFNVPDKTGRVSAMIEPVASRLTAAGLGADSTAIGSVGGVDNVPLQLNHLPTNIQSANPNPINVNVTGNESVSSVDGSAIGGGSVLAGTRFVTPTATGVLNPGSVPVTSSNTGNNAPGSISGLGAITGGSNYTSGSYRNVPLTGGSGGGATANIVVSNGAVTGVNLVLAGTQYVVGDVLGVPASMIGGTGSGFSLPVTAIKNGGKVSITTCPPMITCNYIIRII